MAQVWITGMGLVCALGPNVAEAWQGLHKAHPPLPGLPHKLLSVAQRLGLGQMDRPAFMVSNDVFADGFRHTAFDTYALAKHAAFEALHMAGLTETELAKVPSAVIIGSTAGNALHFLSEYAQLRQEQVICGTGFNDFFAYNPGPALAREWQIQGMAATLGNACCSGADALGLGYSLIKSGLYDRVIAGGADALSLIPYVGFSRLMIYSPAICRPFDRCRQGLNLGEGAGIMVLESSRLLEKRKAQPLASLLGYGSAADAYHLTAPHPEAFGLKRAISAALQEAGFTAHDLAFYNAHGTATPDNDRVEALALRDLLPEVPLWALKGGTGHTLGASGALEAILSVMALRNDELPQSFGFAEPDPELAIAPAKAGVGLRATAALSASLGFGGGNAALVFARA